MKTRIIELIYTQQRTWLWKDWDPVRFLKQLWTKDWILVVEQGMKEYDKTQINLDLIK